MADVSLASRVRIADDAVFRELDGEAVILQLEDGVYFGLDPVGTRLWQLIQAHGRLDGVVDAALGEFDVDRTRLETDVLQLVIDLARRKLVVVEQ
jgi:coenzyme PQQ synthesis protein D (PqqD)